MTAAGTRRTPGQQALYEHYRALGAEVIAPRVAEHWHAARFDREAWDAIVADGIFRRFVPVADGGGGEDWVDCFGVMEGLAEGARDIGFMISVVSQLGIERMLSILGTESQRARWFPRLMAGEVSATALTEASGGSDIARVRTAAVRSNGGYVLNGQKRHITNGPIADIAVVLGRIPELGKYDSALFLIDRDTPGVLRGENEDAFGVRTSVMGALTFENALLDSEQVLGEPGAGRETLARLMAFDRCCVATVYMALIQPLIEDTLSHAQQREAFKAPIAEHQYIQRRITEMVRLREAAWFTAHGAFRLVAAEEPDASMLSSVAKLQSTEACIEAVQHAQSVVGHHLGYETGEITRTLADSLSGRFAGGTEEMQRKNIFAQLTMLHAQREKEAGWLLSSQA